MIARIGSHAVVVPDGRVREVAPVKDTAKYKSKEEGLHATYLLVEQEEGRIQKWAYEPISIRLPGGKTYKPDFVVLMADGRVQIHEVKGAWSRNKRDGITRFHVAAGITCWASFHLFTKERHHWKESVVS